MINMGVLKKKEWHLHYIILFENKNTITLYSIKHEKQDDMVADRLNVCYIVFTVDGLVYLLYWFPVSKLNHKYRSNYSVSII